MEDSTPTTPTLDPLQAALEKAAQALDGCGPATEDVNPEIFAAIINNINYFHKNLQPPANIYDFVQYVKSQFGYEVHQPNTILLRPGDIANKLSIIIKGNVLKIQVRSYDDIDREFKIKHPNQPRRDDEEVIEEEEESDSPKQKAIPRYLQHTLATQKKANTFRLGNYLMAMSKLEEEGKSENPKTLSRSMTSLDSNALKFGTKPVQPGTPGSAQAQAPANNNNNTNNAAASLNEIDFGASQVQEEKTEKAGSGKPEFRRIQTMRAPVNKMYSESMTDLRDEGSQSRRYRSRKNEDTKLNDMSILEDEDPEFLELLRTIGPKYPEIKFFLCDVARFKKVKTYHPGDCLGEQFSKDYRKKESAITLTGSEEVHVITLSRENYKSVLTTMFENAKEKVQFFIDLFPSFEEEVVRKFSYNFCEREFKKNEQIYNENDPSGDVFVLRSGNVKLFKESEAKPQATLFSTLITTSPRSFQKKELAIASIMDKQFFGEEILLNEEQRFCSAVAVTSGTFAYFIEARVYNLIKTNFRELLKTLKVQTRERFEWRQQRAIDLMEQQKHMQPKSIAGPVPVVMPKTQKSNSAAFLMTSKSMKAVDSSMKLVQFESEAEERKAQELQQIKSMVLKTNKVLVGPSVEKNLALYKKKFSRKTKNTDKNIIEERYQKLKAQEAAKATKAAEDLENDLVKYNLRKEFQEKKLNKLRLPSLGNLAMTQPALKGSETARNLTTREVDSGINASIVAPMTTRNKPVKSTVLDYFGLDETDLSNLSKSVKPKRKNFVHAISVQSAVLPSDKPSFLTPRNYLPEEREEHVESAGLNFVKLPKKMPVVNNKWKPKVDADKTKDELNFSGIVGKKPAFSMKEIYVKGI